MTTYIEIGVFENKDGEWRCFFWDEDVEGTGESKKEAIMDLAEKID